MSKKTYTTAAVIIPPTSLWPPIQAIRQEYDRHVKRWMPHITLIYPFRPREELATVAEQFSLRCQNIEPFRVKLVAFSFFQHRRENYTLWLIPEPKKGLVQLQTTLWSMVPDCDDVRKHKDGSTPHLSVGQVQGRTAMLKLQEALQSAWQPLSFMAHEVSLIWRGELPEDVFRVAHRIRLGK